PVIPAWAYVVEQPTAALTEGFQRLLPERQAQAMAAALLIAGAFFLIFLGHHANHEVRRFRSGDDLFYVEKQLGAGLVGRNLEALAIDPELAQPEYGVGDFLAVVGRHQNQPLAFQGIELHGLQIIGLQKLQQHPFGIGRLGAFALRLLVQIALEDLYYLLLFQVGAVAGVLERLPHHVPAAVIQFVFDNDQIAFLVDSQQVQALPGIVKAIEFLLDNQQLVAITLGQCLGVIFQPFLQVLALGETQIAEAFNFQWVDAVGGGVDFKHLLVPPLPLADPLRRIGRVRRIGVWGA